MKFRMGGSGRISIDGRDFVGRDIVIENGKVIVDGVSQEGSLVGPVTINVVGDVEQIEGAFANINVAGAVGWVRTVSGDIRCGDVRGNVETTSGDVNCGKVAGSVRSVSGDITQKVG